MRLNIDKDHKAELSVSFLAAAGSAILLSFAHVFPEFWFISLFALVPFLWRLGHVNLRGVASLGMISRARRRYARHPLGPYLAHGLDGSIIPPAAKEEPSAVERKLTMPMTI